MAQGVEKALEEAKMVQDWRTSCGWAIRSLSCELAAVQEVDPASNFQ